MREIRSEAAVGLKSKRHNVYSSYSRLTNYIAGAAHNVYKVFFPPKHNILCWEQGHIGIRPVVLRVRCADPLDSWWGEALGACALAAVFVGLAFI
jgi:hypothetical protein